MLKDAKYSHSYGSWLQHGYRAKEGVSFVHRSGQQTYKTLLTALPITIKHITLHLNNFQ